MFMDRVSIHSQDAPVEATGAESDVRETDRV